MNDSNQTPVAAPPPGGGPLPAAAPDGASAAAPWFQPAPGETPRAFGAFMAWFHLGHARSLQAVADRLGEGLPTVRNWSSRYAWAERLHNFNSGLLQSSAGELAANRRRQVADWAERLERFREQEWDAAQKLIAAAECFLDSFGEEDLRKMNLAQVSRALKISSAVGRQALAGAELPAAADLELSPVQQQLLSAVKHLYGQQPPSSPSPSPQHNTNNNSN